MEILVDKKLLTEALSRVQGVLVERTLSTLTLDVKTTSFVLSASDNVISVYCTVSCTASEKGSLTFQASVFTEVVKTLPEGTIKIIANPQFLTLFDGTQSFSMKVPLINDYPVKAEPTLSDINCAFRLPSSQLSYMINQVQFCISPESSRNYGSIGYLHFTEQDQLRFVGTDGFRLSYCEIEHKTPLEGFTTKGVCLSKRGINELYRMACEGFEHVDLCFFSQNTLLKAEVSGYRLYISLSSINFHDYRGILPKMSLDCTIISRLALQLVTKRLLLTADKSKFLKLKFKDDQLILSSKNQGNLEAKETLQLDEKKTRDCNFLINGKFFSDIFSSMTSSDLRIKFTSEEAPIEIFPEKEPYECRSRHLLVPIKENSNNIE